MSLKSEAKAFPSAVRDDWVPKAAYLDPEFAKLENERLWPRVWQVACREEELSKPGYFVTTDVGNESFLVVRSNDNQIRAFHNVCQHRGRRLVNVTAGRTHHFTCGFHAWRYNIDGSIRHIPDHQDWGDKLPDCEVGLKPLKVDTWGGFVFVNIDLNAQPLVEFLGQAYQVLNPFEFENMRYRSIRTARLPVNWKVAVEAFNEGYHVQGTHPQALQIMDDSTSAFAYGPHSMFFQPDLGSRGIGQPSSRTNLELPKDLRPGLVGYIEYFERDLGGLLSDRQPIATRRLLTEVDPNASQIEVLTKMVQFWREAAIESGAGWPEKLTAEMVAKAGIDWHLFPNFIILMTPESAICYRIRPDGDNPESCFFDLWAIQRYAPGQEPAISPEYYDPWRENSNWGEVYSQDFANAELVQKGMKSSGFVAARTSPKQEVPISNFHKHVYEYLAE
jgi:nitrite reductase/ring-hydroxylating ferredoxin subunit